MKGARKAALAGSLLLVVFARVVYLAEVRAHPLFDHPAVDAKVYDELAVRIAGGDGYPLGVYASNPFYPYFLAIFYRVFGHSTLPVAAAQLLVGALGSLLLFDIGRRVGGFRTGLFSLLLGGLYVPAIFYEAFLLPTAVGVFVDLLLLALLLRRRPGASRLLLGAAGFLLGVGTLIQGNLLLFFPFLLAWLLFTEPPGRKVGGIGAVVIGLVLAIGPVTGRNLIRGGDYVLVSSHSGINFYMGNNNEAKGVFAFPDERIVLGPENVNIYDSKRIAEAASGRSLKPSEVSTFWTKRALDWIVKNPGRYLELLGRKTALFWNGVEVPDNADLSFFQERVPFLRWLPIGFGLLAPLGLFGVFLLAKRREAAIPLFFLAAQFLSALLFYTHSRYRVPFAVVLALPGAVGLLALAEGLPRWKVAGRLWACGALALLLVLTNAPGFDEGRGIARAFSLTHVADGLLSQGDPAGAEAAYRDALRLLPEYPTARFGLGHLYQRRGALAEAAEEYLAALRAAPTFAEAYANLGVVYHDLGENGKAEVEFREAIRLRPDWAGLRYNLGNVLYDLGRYEEAASHYRIAGERSPGDPLVVRNLSNALEKAGDMAAAEQAVREGLARIGANADLRNRLGDLLEKMGRSAEAMEEYSRAVAIDPHHSAAWNNIGLLRYRLGEIDGAIEAWRTILAYDPASPVIENLRRAEASRGVR